MSVTLEQFLIGTMYEKARTFDKEADNLFTILTFFSHKNGQDEQPCLDIQKTCSQMRNELANLREKHKDTYNRLREKIKVETKQFNKLLYYDLFRESSKAAQDTLKNIGVKTFQLLEDNLNQYIPNPKINKRFSGKALTEYLQHHYNNLYNRYNSSDEESAILFYWGYKEYFVVPKTLSEKQNYIQLSFYHHEVGSTLPVLAHEMGHLLIEKNQELRELKKQIVTRIEKIKSLSGYIDTENFAEELACDFFAYRLHEEAYLLSLFQEIAGTGMVDTFLDRTDPANSLNARPRLVYLTGTYQLTTVLLRLIILLKYSETKNGNFSEIFQAFISVLDEAFFKELPGVYNNFSATFSQEIYSFLNTIHLTVDQFGDFINNIPTFNDGTKTLLPLTQNYLKYWKTRLTKLENNEVPHKNLFRAFILEQEKDNFEPYVLHLYKYHFNTEKGEFQAFLNNKKFAFGIFNAAQLEKKNSSLSFKKDDGNENQQNNEDNRFVYYSRKYSLIKINGKNGASKGPYQLLIFLSIHNACRIENIKDFLDNLQSLFNDSHPPYQLYKALGPKDFLIHFQGLPLEKAWKLKEDFTNPDKHPKDTLHRTYSIVLFDHQSDHQPIESQTDYIPKTKLRIRLSKTGWKDTLSEILKSTSFKCFVKNIYITTGVQDVLIEWKPSFSTNGLIEFYTQVEEAGIATDIQTQIDKEMDLLNLYYKPK